MPVSHSDDILGKTRISELEGRKDELERQYLVLRGEAPESMHVVQAPDQTEAVVPVTNEPTDQTEAVTGGTVSLKTKDISICFEGCHFSQERWVKALSTAKWLQDAKIQSGAAGGNAALWNPLTIAYSVIDRTKGDKHQIS